MCYPNGGTRTKGKVKQDPTAGHCGPGLLRTSAPSITGWGSYYGLHEHEVEGDKGGSGVCGQGIYRKFYADKASERPVARIHGGLHTLIHFAVEDWGGGLGAHAQAFLHTLAERAVRQGRRSRARLRDPGGNVLRSDGATRLSLRVQSWQRHISSWLHLSLSRRLLRLF